MHRQDSVLGATPIPQSKLTLQKKYSANNDFGTPVQYKGKFSPVNDNGTKEKELFSVDDTSLFGKSMIGGCSSAITNDTPFKLPYQTSPRF